MAKKQTAYTVAARIEALQTAASERSGKLMRAYMDRVNTRFRSKLEAASEALLSQLDQDERAKAERIMAMAPNPVTGSEEP